MNTKKAIHLHGTRFRKSKVRVTRIQYDLGGTGIICLTKTLSSGGFYFIIASIHFSFKHAGCEFLPFNLKIESFCTCVDLNKTYRPTMYIRL